MINIKKIGVKDILLFLVVFAVGIIMILPFIWMVIVTLEANANVAPPLPPKFTISEPSLFNLELVMYGGRLVTAYQNSFLIAIGSVVVNLISVLLGGYALSKGRFRGRSVLIIIIISTMMIPFESRFIPMFLFFSRLGLVNNYAPLILPSLVDAFGIILAKQFFDTVPDSLRESAFIDGSGEFNTFLKIYVPLSGPITTTLGLLAFLNSWNSFLWPLVMITDPKVQTIPLYISSFATQDATRQVGTTMAVAFMAVLPVIFVYLFLQRYIIQSIASSGMKG